MANKIISVLDKIARVPGEVFAWLGSTTGEAVISGAENIAEDLGAPVAIVSLINNWLQEIIKTETLAVAAGATTGVSAQKAAMVLNSVTPQLTAYLQANGLSAMTAKEIDSINSELVGIFNKFIPASKTTTNAVNTNVSLGTTATLNP